MSHAHGQYLQQTQFQAAQMQNNPHMLQLQSAGHMTSTSQGGGPYANPLQPGHHTVFPGYPGPSVG